MTEGAIKKVTSIKNKRQTPDAYFRISLKSGGCSGLSYNYDLVTEPPEGDRVFEFGELKICIDKKSYLFLNGTEIDYVISEMGEGFRVNNPNPAPEGVKGQCNCGSDNPC